MRKLILLALALIGSLGASAAIDPGWYKYPVFSDTINTVVEASNKVYYLSESSLFSFSPEDQETYSYSSINKLTGDDISNIYYNYDKKYLLIVYSDCNMDVLYDDGTLVNLPEIRDAKQITSTKTINDVAFGEDRIAIATTFGIVIYDDKKLEVRESGIYNHEILNIAIMNGYLLIFYRTNEPAHNIYISPIDERHNSIDKFTRLYSIYINMMLPISDTQMLARGKSNGLLMKLTFDFDAMKVTREDVADTYLVDVMRQYENGYYGTNGQSLITCVDGQISKKALPETLWNQSLGMRVADQVWLGNGDGLALYDISSSTPTVLYDKMFPTDATTVKKVGTMHWSTDGERLYIMNIVASTYKGWCSGENKDEYQTANILSDGFIQDVSLKDATVVSSNSIKYQTNHSNKRMYGDAINIYEDVDDPDVYYCSNNYEGVYVVKYNETSGKYEELGLYTCENAPFYTNSSGIHSRVEHVSIDPAGNLWVGNLNGWCMLPAEKRKLYDPSAISKSDWKEATKINTFITPPTGKDMNILFCKKSNMAFYYSSLGNGGFIAVDTKGTYSDLSDDTVLAWTQFTDQDGNNFEAPSRITHMIEDSRGCVWVGTSAGVFEITTPSNATSASMTVRRIKVPRNDGTNYADYLLDSDMINWICVDPSDRKWIATENSGLFLVSEIGDEIILNYHEDNSSLPSNQICCVECDKSSNKVYVGTSVGLYSFLSDSAPANGNYDAVYAYPNPVRVDFSGDVTIAGLMENSIVKIADTAGRVVYQTRSEGGMATWPVTNQAGKRVKTGVYYIFTTSYNNEQAAGAVAKILVMN